MTRTQQKHFFDTFGYLVLPGLVADEIGWITSEFEAVFTDRGIIPDPTKRECIVPFIDQREKFCTLLDNPALTTTIGALIGDDFNYNGGDGNYYTGDTGWHPDGQHRVGLYLKVAFYLDVVKRDTGALRVIPGSHRLDDGEMWAARQAGRSEELWGIAGRDVPAIALESNPGDVVMFNHNLMHAAFGGSTRRRMFTMNCCRHAETPEEIMELENGIAGAARFWVEHVHSEIMRGTASPERMRHLRQPMEHEGHLAALSAKARQEMAEPARG